MEMIGFIGLGTVGGAVAANLRKAGYQMRVYDICPDAVELLVAHGARALGTADEVARQCPIVFTSLPGPPEVEQVTLGSTGLLHGIHEGSLYVDLSSSDPNLIRRIANAFRPRAARVMDAPLIAGKHGIANRSVQVLASGTEDCFREVKPVLDAFADTVVYTGDLGTGTVIKLAHNLVRRGIGLAIGEGIVLGAKARVDPELLWACMHWGLDVQLHQLAKTLPETVFKGNYEAPAGFGIGLARKDVGLATELGRQHNVPLPIAALVEQMMIQAVGRGWSNQSTASLFRLQEEAAGIEVRKSSA